MTNQKILDNATHVDTEGDYWLISSQDKPQVYLYEEWTYCEPRTALRSLADIKRIAELEKAIRYSSDYLDDNKLNSIGSGSKAHVELREALKEQDLHKAILSSLAEIKSLSFDEYHSVLIEHADGPIGSVLIELENVLKKFRPLDEDGNGWDFIYSEGSEYLGEAVLKALKEQIK